MMKIFLPCFIIVFILFAAAVPGAYAVNASKAANDLIESIHYKRGIDFYKRTNYEQAIRELNEALALNPQNKKAQKYLHAAVKKNEKQRIYQLYDEAKEYTRTKQYQKAADAYQKVLTLVPEDGFSKHNMVLLEARIDAIEKRAQQQRIKEEQRLTNDVLRQRKKEVKSAYHEGMRQYQQKNYASAINSFNGVLALQSDHANAKTYLERATKKKNQCAIDEAFEQGRAYEDQGQQAQALERYQRTLVLMQEGGYSSFDNEKVKARIEKMQWFIAQKQALRSFESLQKKDQEASVEQQIKDFVGEQSHEQEEIQQNKAAAVALALEEADQALTKEE